MEPFLGEIRLVGFNFAPQGWAFCNGQLLSVNQNTALFSLLGVTYGGDGITTFALPDLQGPIAAPLRVGHGPEQAEPGRGRRGGAGHADRRPDALPQSRGVLSRRGRRRRLPP